MSQISRIFRRYYANMTMGRGALIVFEGLDRSGKSTQSQRLMEMLEKDKIPCQLQRFPDRTTAIGKMISSYLSQKSELEDHAIHLLFSANRWEVSRKIKELLEKGVTVVLDRYSFSGVVYTAAKKDFSIDWCKQPEVGLPKPDLVLFLYTSAQVLMSRADYGDERYENASFQSKVLEHYIKLKEDYWKELDASLSIDAIHDEIMTSVRPIIEQVKDQPIRGLWTESSAPTKAINGHATVLCSNGHGGDKS